MDRRQFVKYSSLSGFLTLSPKLDLWDTNNLTNITILHTNDVHSRIDPFPNDGSRNANLGGASKRAAMINKIRKDVDHCILLDSGDIFQGTPYFNFFQGELEIKLMSKMGYDVGTIGNHDFDAGVDNLAKQFKHASFSLVNHNYKIEDSALSEVVKKDVIIEKGGIKFGILGLGIELDGLVPENLIQNIKYQNPIECAQKQADRLKNELGCDVVICLSHLGYKYDRSKVCDIDVAKMTRNIDIILGGHTHTFMKKPDIQKNLDGEPVIINQAGWAGIMLGRIDLVFEKNSLDKCVTCKNLLVS